MSYNKERVSNRLIYISNSLSDLLEKGEYLSVQTLPGDEVEFRISFLNREGRPTINYRVTRQEIHDIKNIDVTITELCREVAERAKMIRKLEVLQLWPKK